MSEETNIETNTEGTPIVGGGAPEAGVPEWISSQPEDLRESLKGYETQEAALRDISVLKTKLSESGLRAPGKDADDAAWDAYRKARRGGISDPKNYTFNADDARLDGMGMSRSEYEALSKDLFDKGFSDDVHSDVMSAIEKLTKDEVSRLQNARAIERATTEANLKREWGADNYAKNINAVNALLKRFPGMDKVIAENGLGVNEAVIRMLHAFAQEAEEGTFGGGEGNGGADPDQLLQALRESPEYRNISHPGHASAMKREMELYERKARKLARGF